MHYHTYVYSLLYVGFQEVFVASVGFVNKKIFRSSHNIIMLFLYGKIDCNEGCQNISNRAGVNPAPTPHFHKATRQWPSL